MTKVFSSTLPIDFIEYCRDIPDSRHPVRLTYPVDEVMFLGLCGVMCGCEGWDEIHFFGDNHINFLQKYLPYKDGIPSCRTISRVFGMISPNIFEDFFNEWFGALLLPDSLENLTIAIDGKTVFGSKAADIYG